MPCTCSAIRRHGFTDNHMDMATGLCCLFHRHSSSDQDYRTTTTISCRSDDNEAPTSARVSGGPSSRRPASAAHQGPVLALIRDHYTRLGSVFTVRLFHLKLTFLVGPDVSSHFYRGLDSEISQDEVSRSLGSSSPPSALASPSTSITPLGMSSSGSSATP